MPLPSLILPIIIQLIRQLLPAPDPAVIHLQISHSLIPANQPITIWGNHFRTSNEFPNMLVYNCWFSGYFPMTFRRVFNLESDSFEITPHSMVQAAFASVSAAFTIGRGHYPAAGTRIFLNVTEERNNNGTIVHITSNTVSFLVGNAGEITTSPQVEAIIPQIPEDLIVPTNPHIKPDENIISHIFNRFLQAVPINEIPTLLKDFTDDIMQSVITLIEQGLLFIGKAEEIGHFLISNRFGKIRKFETLAELQAELKNIPNNTVIAVRNNILPFGKSGEKITLKTTNPEPIILTILGVILSWKFILAVLTFKGLYVAYQVFKQPEAVIIDETPETITITSAGRVIVLNRHTGEIISDTGDPTTPIEAITQNDKLLLIGGGAVGGFILASLLRR